MAESFDLGFPPHAPNIGAIAVGLQEAGNHVDTLHAMALEPVLRTLVAARDQYAGLSRRALAATIKSMSAAAEHATGLAQRALAGPSEVISAAQIAVGQMPVPLPPRIIAPPPVGPGAHGTPGAGRNWGDEFMEAAGRCGWPPTDPSDEGPWLIYTNGQSPTTFGWTQSDTGPPGMAPFGDLHISAKMACCLTTALQSLGWTLVGALPDQTCSTLPGPPMPPVPPITPPYPPHPGPTLPPSGGGGPTTAPPCPPAQPGTLSCISSADMGWCIDQCSDQDLTDLSTVIGQDYSDAFGGTSMDQWWLSLVGQWSGRSYTRQIGSLGDGES